MSEHEIHDTLPSGFAYADELQVASYRATGSVNGAAKVALVRADADTIRHEAQILEAHGGISEGYDPEVHDYAYFWSLAERETARLAVRLRPPRRWGDVISPLARRWAARTGFVVDNPDNDETLRSWLNRRFTIVKETYR